MTTQQIVKSVTPIAITIPAGATSATQTVSVVAANSFIEWDGQTCQVGAGTPNTSMGGLVLTNGTTVTAKRDTLDASNSLTLYGTLYEFAAGVLKTNQSGIITLSATSATATITGVTTGNAAVVYQGATYSGTNDFSHNVFYNLALTNSTTVTAARVGSTDTISAYYTVIEFNSGILNSSTQPAPVALSTAQTTNTATITGVTAANSMLLYGGQQMSTSSATWTQWDEDNAWVTLTNGTTLTATRTATSSTTIAINATVIEFKSNVIKSVNRGGLVIGAAANSNTQTITAVNTAFTGVGLTGFTASGGSGTTQDNVKESAVVLTNSTTLTASTNSNNATHTRTVGYEAIEFYPYGVTTGNMFLVM